MQTEDKKFIYLYYFIYYFRAWITPLLDKSPLSFFSIPHGWQLLFTSKEKKKTDICDNIDNIKPIIVF